MASKQVTGSLIDVPFIADGTTIRTGIKNGVLEDVAGHGLCVVPRNGITNITNYNSVPANDARVLPTLFTYGRDVYFVIWEGVALGGGALLKRIKDTAQGTNTLESPGTLTTDTDYVHISWSSGDGLIYIRSANIDSSTSGARDHIYNVTAGTVTAISDADHPFNATRGGVPGVVFLDGYWFIADAGPSGDPSRIYNSDLGSATAWTSTNYIEATLENDKILYLAKHQNHVVAFGERTIQFFYNAGNPNGSPLAPRKDIFHYFGLHKHRQYNQASVGLYNLNSVFNFEDKIYFIGRPSAGEESKGAGGVYVMENFSIKKISTPEVDSYLGALATADIDMDFSIAGVVKQNGRPYLIVAAIDIIDSSRRINLIYDLQAEKWMYWDTQIISCTYDGVIIDARDGQDAYINSIGDVAQPARQDTIGGSASTFTFQIDTPVTNGIDEIPESVGKLKFFNSLKLNGPISSSTMGVSYTDNEYSSYSTSRSLSLANPKNRLNRLGSSVSRAWRFSHATNSEYPKLKSVTVDTSTSIF